MLREFAKDSEKLAYQWRPELRSEEDKNSLPSPPSTSPEMLQSMQRTLRQAKIAFELFRIPNMLACSHRITCTLGKSNSIQDTSDGATCLLRLRLKRPNRSDD